MIHSIFSLSDAGGVSPSEGDNRLMALLSDDLDGEELEAFQALLDGAFDQLRLEDGRLVLPESGKGLPAAAELEGLAEALQSGSPPEDAMAALVRLMRLEMAQAESDAPSRSKALPELLNSLRPPERGHAALDSRLTEMRPLTMGVAPGQGGPGFDLGGRDMMADMDWLKNRIQERLSTLLSTQQQGQERGGGEPLIREVGSGGHQAQSASPQQLAALMSTASQSGESSSMNRLPPVQAPVGGPNWGDALGQRILMMKGQGIDRAEIKLNPPHLGPLEIRVAVTQEQTSLLMSSQHALTRDALEQALPRLREMLQDKGLEMGDAEVSDGREEQLAQEEKGDEQAGERDGGTGPGSSASKAGVETAVLREGQVSLLDEYV